MHWHLRQWQRKKQLAFTIKLYRAKNIGDAGPGKAGMAGLTGGTATVLHKAGFSFACKYIGQC